MPPPDRPRVELHGGSRRRRLGLALLLIVVGVCVGLLVGRIESGSEAEHRSVEADLGPVQDRWSVVFQALEDEVEARRELAREVADLRDALAAAGLLDPHRDAGIEEPETDAELEGSPGDDALAPDEIATGGSRSSFDVDKLVDAGFDPRRAEALRERWEEYTLEKLYLRDQAAREGWMTAPRHMSEQIALVERLREEIGEEAYAAMLYAQGEPNTLEVTDVLERSAASDAGLEPGDTILRYDGVRVFRPNGLRFATAGGEPGDYVTVELIRDGRPLRVRVRRGPLGVLLRGASRPPTP